MKKPGMIYYHKYGENTLAIIHRSGYAATFHLDEDEREISVKIANHKYHLEYHVWDPNEQDFPEWLDTVTELVEEACPQPFSKKMSQYISNHANRITNFFIG